jgi:hypothetical protein
VDDAPPLDREAVERVLRRASELADAEPAEMPAVGGIDAAALVAAAAEVGIPADAVRRAIARERLGPPAAAHLGDRLVGAATVVVDGEVPGRAADVLARLDAWLVAGHHLRRDRLRDGRGEWSKRTGLVGATMRSVRGVFGEGKLGDLHRIVAVARDTGTGTCVVRIEADRHHDRAVRATTGALVGAAGTAGVVVAAVVTGPLLLVVVPVTAVAGVGLAATGRGRASRVGRELDRVLDAVDQQIKPARLGVDVVRRVVGVPRRV